MSADDEEFWQPIRNTNGHYSISTRGRIRRNAGVITVQKPVKQRILKAKDDAWISLSVDGITTFHRIETLLSQTFGGRK